MAWVKIDDSIFFHEKIVSAGNAAVGAWMRMLAWSANHLTDGHIPVKIAMLLSEGDQSSIDSLINCQLLEQQADGYAIHDYLEYNPPSSEVRSQREAVSEARRNAGIRSGEARRQANDEQTTNKTGTNDEQKTNKIEPRTRTRTRSPYDLRSTSTVDHERALSTTSENGARISLSDFSDQVASAGLAVILGRSDRERFSKLVPVAQYEIDHAIERAMASGTKKVGYVLSVIEGERERAATAKDQPPSQGPPDQPSWLLEIAREEAKKKQGEQHAI